MLINKLIYKILINRGKALFNEFENNSKKAFEINESILMEILNDNKNTEYGDLHSFETINTIEDFKFNVPLNNYDNFKPYIDRMVKGESNILLNSSIEYFSHTSGTTGYQKLIPNSKKSRIKASKYMGLLTQFIVFNYLKYKWTYERGLMLTDMLSNKSDNGPTISSATSGGMRSIKALIPYIWTSPVEVMEIEDRETALYLHLLFALLDENLMYIGGTFISSILDLFRVLEKNYNSLLTDINNGLINNNLDIEYKTRVKLNKKLSTNLSRATILKKEFDKGFNNIVKRIWPKLAVIMTVTGDSFSIYNEKVRYYSGNIPIYSSVYGASESSIGINPYLNEIAYVLLPDAAFFEFIKEDDIFLANPKTYNLNELLINKNYEIVVTSFNGLYRYRLGDVVKIIGYYNKSPKLIFMYRKNQLLNMVSEKTTESQVKSSLKSFEKTLNLKIIDYCTSPNNKKSPGNYLFFLELADNTYNTSKLEDILDKELRIFNKAYDRFRSKNTLSKLQIILLKSGSFEILKDSLLESGASKNQLKIPRVITSGNLLKKLNELSNS